jgi:hypothetical protein
MHAGVVLCADDSWHACLPNSSVNDRAQLLHGSKLHACHVVLACIEAACMIQVGWNVLVALKITLVTTR